MNGVDSALPRNVLCITKFRAGTMDVDKALAEIAAIRLQVARGVEFRGYGPATLAATGLIAALAAAAQGAWLGDPLAAPLDYLALWVAAALVSAVLIGAETVTRSRRIHSDLAEEMIWLAAEQFVPAAAAGALLTAVIAAAAPDALWMLPGLWQVVFSLGIFASCRFLPRRLFAAGVWYLATGLACLAFASGEHALSPWAMGAPYALGQLGIAAILQAHARSARDG